MGIQGLIQFLKNSDESVSAIKPSHLSKFRGKRAAIDAYSWLHKSVFTCAHDLFLKKPTTKYVDYCLKNLRILQDHAIVPILVFDGGRMPFKVVNEKRRKDRQKAKKEATDLIALGKMNEAFSQMVQSFDITHEMASNLMKAARNIGVESVVAPYEADAQLVYLEKQGLVDFIISEDSDLIIFGAKKVFLKMSPSGHGELFDSENVPKCLVANKRLKNANDFNFDKLLYTAILSGCDYVKNIPGIGLIKAWKFMHMTENTNIRQFLKKIPSYLKLTVMIEDDYIESFVMAVISFKYQIVFDTRQKKRVPLNALENVEEDDHAKFRNSFKVYEIDHLQLALGNIDHRNTEYDNYHPHFQSYLFYGGTTTTKVEKILPESPSFNMEGVYKRRRGDSETSPKKEISLRRPSRDLYSDEEEELAAYRKMDLRSKKASPVKVEKVEEPPVKRIKCKFLKNKPKLDDEDFQPLKSRFFKDKNKENKEDDKMQKDNESMNTIDLANESIDRTIENIVDFDSVLAEVGVKLEDNQIDDVSGEKSPIKSDAVCKIESPTNEVEIIEVLLSPVIENLSERMKPKPEPESPVIGGSQNSTKPKLNEIQNIQKFAKGKRKILTKNQPTLLGFFKKL